MAGCFQFPYQDLVRPPQRGEQWEKLDFMDNMLLGYFFKSHAVLLFETAGYEVYPFGYESLLPALKRRLYPGASSDVEQRIRATPDLLLRDPDNGDCFLVEVKYRTGDPVEWDSVGSFTSVRMDEIPLYKQFWPESVLVLFTCASDRYVYAQKVSEVTNDTDLVEVEYRPAEEIFTRLTNLDEYFRRKVARKVATMDALRREGRI